MQAHRLIALITLPAYIFGAIYLNWNQNPLSFDGQYALVKAAIWLSLFLFCLYSGYCTIKEDLLATIKKITTFHFGRQVCLDLYLGLFVVLFIIYLNEPTLLGFMAWAIPSLFFVNILTLLYFGIHFDAIVANLTAMIG